MNDPARNAAEMDDRPGHPRRGESAALMPLAEAVALLTKNLAPVPPQDVPLAEAIGRIAAADALPERALPARPIALRDGWAARADDVLGASPYGPILLARPLAWVESGGVMPEGTDVVLPFEALDGRSVIADAPAGVGMRGAGEEFPTHGCFVQAGDRMTPLRRLALETLGVASVPVRIPRLRLVVTGSPEPETQSAFVKALAVSEGAAVLETVCVASRPEAIAETLRAPDADATLVLGGTGFGRGDQSAAGLAQAGSVRVHGIALNPGGTAGFGEAEARPVLLLPGRPDAALAAFLTLGRPLLAALTGARPPVPTRAPLLRKITSTIGLSEIVFARRERDGVLPLGGADLPLHRLIEADAAILVAAQTEGYPPGTSVEVMAL